MKTCDRCGKKERFLFPYRYERLCEKCFDPIAKRLTGGDEEYEEDEEGNL